MIMCCIGGLYGVLCYFVIFVVMGIVFVYVGYKVKVVLENDFNKDLIKLFEWFFI